MAKTTRKTTVASPAESGETKATPNSTTAILKQFPVLANPDTVLLKNEKTQLYTAINSFVYNEDTRRPAKKRVFGECTVVYKTTADGTITDGGGREI